MKKLMFWLEYKTIKNDDNSCVGCHFYKYTEPCSFFIGGRSCYRKTFKKRDYEQIALTTSAVVCVILFTIYLVLNVL